MVSKTNASLVLLLGIFANLRGASAEEASALPLRFTIDNPTACSSEGFEVSLKEHVRRPFVFDDRAPTVLRYWLTDEHESVPRSGVVRTSRMRGRAVFEGRAGKDERTIEGDTCEELAHAMALVVSTWIEAEPLLSPIPAAPPSASSATPSATPRPAVSARRPERPLRARERHFFLGGHAVVSTGLAQETSVGGDVALSGALPRQYELRGSLRVLYASRASAIDPSTSVWVTMVADACKNFAVGVLTASLCGRVEPGLVHVALPDVEHLLPWVTGGVGARAGLRFWGRARVEVEAFAHVLVTGYRIRGADVTLVPFRAFAPSAAFGVIVPIW